MAEFTLRKAHADDAIAIQTVLVRSVREICAPDYNHDEQILSNWCANKTIENIQKWTADPNLHFVVAEQRDGPIVGVGLLNTTSGMLALCYLLPEVKGKGVGKAILRSLEDAATTHGITTIVLSSSITAESFYLHHGYISNGPPDDSGIRSLPMKKDLGVGLQ